MTTFKRDHDGIPRCQACNGQMILTQDSHYLVCENGHGKLVSVDVARATIIRQAYKRRDNPSKADLDRRWKDGLPVAVKVGTITRETYERDKTANRKEQVAIYKIGEHLCESFCSADPETIATVQQYVGCTVSKSGVKSAKLFELASQETVALVLAKAKKKAKGDQK